MGLGKRSESGHTVVLRVVLDHSQPGDASQSIVVDGTAERMLVECINQGTDSVRSQSPQPRRGLMATRSRLREEGVRGNAATRLGLRGRAPAPMRRGKAIAVVPRRALPSSGRREILLSLPGDGFHPLGVAAFRPQGAHWSDTILPFSMTMRLVQESIRPPPTRT